MRTMPRVGVPRIRPAYASRVGALKPVSVMDQLQRLNQRSAAPRSGRQRARPTIKRAVVAANASILPLEFASHIRRCDPVDPHARSTSGPMRSPWRPCAGPLRNLVLTAALPARLVRPADHAASRSRMVEFNATRHTLERHRRVRSRPSSRFDPALRAALGPYMPLGVVRCRLRRHVAPADSSNAWRIRRAPRSTRSRSPYLFAHPRPSRRIIPRTARRQCPSLVRNPSS